MALAGVFPMPDIGQAVPDLTGMVTDPITMATDIVLTAIGAGIEDRMDIGATGITAVLAGTAIAASQHDHTTAAVIVVMATVDTAVVFVATAALEVDTAAGAGSSKRGSPSYRQLNRSGEHAQIK